MGDTGGVADMTLGVYRRVYAGLTDDRRLAGVSVEAEAWMTRVLVAADDFGNVPADPVVLYTRTVGRRLGVVTVDQVTGWVDELVGAGLLLRYEAAGEWFVHVAGFEQVQPGPRNGKRIRRTPASPFDGGASAPAEENGADAAGVSRPIRARPDDRGGGRGNPDASSASKASESESDTESEKGGAEPPAAPAPRTPAAPADPPLMEFPCIPGGRNKATTWGLTRAQVDDWAGTFAAVDVPQQCREARSWILAKPANRKTADGMADFLRRWLAKEQDKGGGRTARPAQRVEMKPGTARCA